jgi:hypothetical protein
MTRLIKVRIMMANKVEDDLRDGRSALEVFARTFYQRLRDNAEIAGRSLMADIGQGEHLGRHVEVIQHWMTC